VYAERTAFLKSAVLGLDLPRARYFENPRVVSSILTLDTKRAENKAELHKSLK
jgi:hypothetical protein